MTAEFDWIPVDDLLDDPKLAHYGLADLKKIKALIRLRIISGEINNRGVGFTSKSEIESLIYLKELKTAVDLGLVTQGVEESDRDAILLSHLVAKVGMPKLTMAKLKKLFSA